MLNQTLRLKFNYANISCNCAESEGSSDKSLLFGDIANDCKNIYFEDGIKKLPQICLRQTGAQNKI
jgi:hypothetical protein